MSGARITNIGSIAVGSLPNGNIRLENDVSGGITAGVVPISSRSETNEATGMIPASNTLSGTTPSPLSPVDWTSDCSSRSFTVNNGQTGSTPACFRAGTRIMTARGPVSVEALVIGDLALTTGPRGDGIHPVRWIGWRVVDCLRHPEPEKVWPVRVRAGAFARGVPARDLWLSPDHAVFLDGVLVPVKCLVDGGLITREPVDTVRYFHVQLPHHDVVLAEGLACESYLDSGDRANFANGGRVIRLHPGFARGAWDAEGCAPLHVAGPVISRARSALRKRAQRLGISSHATG